MFSDIRAINWASKRESIRLLSLSGIIMALDLIINRETERITRNTDRLVVIYNPSNAIVQLLDSFAIKIVALGIEERFTTQIYYF
jgi:hypothetical protein